MSKLISVKNGHFNQELLRVSGPFSGELFKGLRSLAESSFPKLCSSCGKCYEIAGQFISEAEAIRAGQNGLKQSYDDDEKSIVKASRNGSCGSTLMDFFSDRRNISDSGRPGAKKKNW